MRSSPAGGGGGTTRFGPAGVAVLSERRRVSQWIAELAALRGEVIWTFVRSIG